MASQRAYDFVQSQPDSYFFCPVSNLLLLDPHQTICCNEHLSREVAEEAKRNRDPCPLCKEPSLQTMPDGFHKKRVLSLWVRCPYKESGCKWTGLLGALEKPHLCEGQREGECLYAELACPHSCGLSVQRSDLERHCASDCSRRPYTCDYCAFEGPYEDIVGIHWEEACEEYPISCPNKCGEEGIARKKVIEHMENSCSNQIMECEFGFAGCDARIIAGEMESHLVEGQHAHLSMVAELCKEVPTLRQDVADLGNCLLECGKEVEELRAQVAVIPELREHIKKLEAKLAEVVESQKKLATAAATTTTTTASEKASASPPRQRKTGGTSTNKFSVPSMSTSASSTTSTTTSGKPPRSYSYSGGGGSGGVSQYHQSRASPKNDPATASLSSTHHHQPPAKTTNTTTTTTAPAGAGGGGQAVELRKRSTGSQSKRRRMSKVPSPCDIIMNNYLQHRRFKDVWFSTPFYSHAGGYKMCFKIVANGIGDGEGTHVSLSIVLMKGENDGRLAWPFRGEITVGLVNWEKRGPDHEVTIYWDDAVTDDTAGRPKEQMNTYGWGEQLFIAHEELDYNSDTGTQYLKDDCIKLTATEVVIYC